MTVQPQPQSFITVLDVKRINDAWCVFRHHASFADGSPPEIIFVHCCPLAEVYTMNEAKNNSEWLKIYEKGGPIIVEIMAITDSMIEARNYAIKHIKTLDKHPRCNLMGFNIRQQRHRLECSNGETYENQPHAAKALGLSQGAISRHLKGELKHVGGYTFTRAIE